MSEQSVKIVECPRDAWQGLARQIPAEVKAEYLRALVGAGFKHIDAVSFVSPRAVPQMADSEDVLKRLNLPELAPSEDVEIIGIVVNERGAERAIATEAVRTLGFPYSLSETFLRKNQNQSAEENSEALEAIWAKAEENGLGLVAYISMAFGNPYGDPWDPGEVVQAVQNIADMGIGSLRRRRSWQPTTQAAVASIRRWAAWEDVRLRRTSWWATCRPRSCCVRWPKAAQRSR
jgi:hydroxymethylglutaryl-CoA lyase